MNFALYTKIEACPFQFNRNPLSSPCEIREAQQSTHARPVLTRASRSKRIMGGTGVSDQLVEEVIATIRKHAGAATSADCEEITVATELTSLGLDSLDLADLLWDLEEANNVEIHMNIADAWSNLHTVGDLVESLRTLMAKVS